MANRRRVETALLLLLAAALIVLSPAPGAAQAIRGVVVDDLNLTPVPGAIVRLVWDGGTGGGIETDASGRFFFPLQRGGEYRLEVARMGYQTTLSQLLTVEPGDTVSVEFMVRPGAVLLAPLTITGRSRLGRNAFEHRRQEWDRGFFFTPSMIDSISPRYPVEVLKGVEKVDVRWGWGVSSTGFPGPIPTVRTSLGRGCVLYMVDFMPVNPPPWVRGGDWSGPLLSHLTGKDIVAVEAYRSVLEVPPELRRHTDRLRTVWRMGAMGVTRQEDIQCGLVIFWTGSGW